jgi:hypothetical protein
MDTLYHKLNKKLDALTKQTQTTCSNKKNRDTQPKLLNLTHISFNRERVNALALRLNCAIQKHPKQYIKELIIDTENAIRQLDPNIQSPIRFLAATKVKQIMASNIHHTLHKRYQHNINQINDILHKNNLTVARADKNKAMAIIHKDLEQKINTEDNHITCLNLYVNVPIKSILHTTAFWISRNKTTTM